MNLFRKHYITKLQHGNFSLELLHLDIEIASIIFLIKCAHKLSVVTRALL
jgi:hypothetical protein